MKIVKGLIVTVFCLVLLAAIAIGVLIFVIDPNEYKDDIEQLAKQQNISLQINGDLGWSFWPHLAININDTEVSGEDIPDVQVQTVKLALDTKALLGKTVSIQHIDIDRADIRISLDAKNNREQIAGVTGAPVTAASATTSADAPVQLNIKQINIHNSSLELLEKGKVQHRLDNLNIESQNLNVHSQAFPFAISFNISLDESLPPSPISLQGDLTINEDLSTILLSRATAQLSNFHKDISDPLKLETDLNLQTKAATRHLDLTRLKISLGDFISSGKASAVLGGKNPKINLNLSGNELNLNELMPSSESSGTNASEQAVSSTAQENILAPILAPLLLLEQGSGNINIKLDKLTSGEITLNNIVVKAVGQQSLIKLSELSAESWGGKINLNANLNARNKVPSLNFALQTTQIDINQALSDFADIDNVYGQADLKFKGRSKGSTSDRLTQHLTGNGSFVLRNPKFDGVNIEQQYCNLAAMVEKYTMEKKDWANYTQFQDIESTITVANQKVTFSNLDSAMGNLTIGGTGLVILDQEKYQMDIVARLNGDKTSETGCVVKSRKVRDTDVPLRCSGNFNGDLSCKPDPDFIRRMVEGKITDSLLKKLAPMLDKNTEQQNPDSTETTTTEQAPEKKVEDQLKDALKSFF